MPSAELLDEMKAWESLGVESLSSFYEDVHDHGWIEKDGKWTPLPSGEVGEKCQTCGKLIEPIPFTPA